MALSDWARILAHILRGRIRLYQCYTNINWRTCEACLSWHGRILANPQDFPAHDDCPHEVLPFPVHRLAEHRRKGERMQAKAAEELRRRQKWSQATELLPKEPMSALNLFREAVQTDVYLPEVEELVGRNSAWFAENPDVRAALREILVAGWKAKFAKERYERQPELARTSQEKYGLARLKELLP